LENLGVSGQQQVALRLAVEECGQWLQIMPMHSVATAETSNEMVLWFTKMGSLLWGLGKPIADHPPVFLERIAASNA
jgi:hypothetical protein